MLFFTGDHSTILFLSFVPFLISLLVSFSSSLSVIIYQPEEGIYLDGIVYSRIHTKDLQGPASKGHMRSEHLADMGSEHSADLGPELDSCRSIARCVYDGECFLFFYLNSLSHHR